MMVNVPKQRRTFCKKCKVLKLHKVTQYKKSKERKGAQHRSCYDRKQQGFGGRTKNIFRKKTKTKIILHMECTECKYRKQTSLLKEALRSFKLPKNRVPMQEKRHSARAGKLLKRCSADSISSSSLLLMQKSIVKMYSLLGTFPTT